MSFARITHNLKLRISELGIAMSSIEDDVKDAGDKMQAGAKAAGNKMADTDKDTETEYNKEKIKEKMD